jgi:hypothetical protein
MSSIQQKHGVIDQITECTHALEKAQEDDSWEDVPEAQKRVFTSLKVALSNISRALTELDEQDKQMATDLADSIDDGF